MKIIRFLGFVSGRTAAAANDNMAVVGVVFVVDTFSAKNQRFLLHLLRNSKVF